MDNSDLVNEVLKHVGGLKENDLNEVLRNFDDSEEEIQTFCYSPYIDISNLDSISMKGKFSILSLNVQSIFAKFDNLLCTLDILSSRDVSFSAICLQECWLHEDHDLSILEIPNYQMVAKTRKCCGHGGLLIYLHQDFTYTEIKTPDSDIWESLSLEIFHENLKNKITLTNLYRPPKLNNCNTTIDQFLTEFHPLLHRLSSDNCDSVITGDFNIDLLKISERSKYQEYYDMLVASGFYPQIMLPTRFSKKNGTLIDQTFVKFTNTTNPSRSGIIMSGISDHLPHYTWFDIGKLNNNNPKLVKINRNNTASVNNFLEDLQTELGKIETPQDILMDPNVTYNALACSIKSCKDKHLEPKFVKFKKYKHKKSPWVTQGILNSIKFRDRLYKKLRSTDPTSSLYSTLEINFRTYRNLLQKNINSAKKSYYFDQFKKYTNDARKTWSKINEILNKCPNKKDFPSHFMLNDRKIENKTEIADGFNSYFSSIGQKLSSKISTNSDKTIESYLIKNIACSFHFKLVSQDDVKKVIRDLKPKHSAGHDDISTHLLKSMSNMIAPLLTLSINQSLCTGIFPDQLKVAKVIPLYKKDDQHLFDNYRPISLLPAISKVFEKIAFIQVYDYLEKNNLLYSSQYGFRALHSTELAALEMTDIISKTMDSGKIPISIFLDLSKAFDTLDHTILLKKMQHYGFQGVALAWFKSYLSGRMQFVNFDGIQSSLLSLDTGVPQGSILGPLLFIIYMNDINVASKKFTAILYADDSNLVSSLCSFDTPLNSNDINKNLLGNNITHELDKIHIWLQINKLSLNTKKTKFMVFHHRQRDVSDMIPKVEINGQAIEKVSEFNFLGLIIDDHLNWDAHIQKTSNKVSRALGIMYRLKRFLPRNILRLLYNSLILPHLQYGIVIWGYKHSRLAKLQKRAVRTLCNSKYNAHTEPLFKRLNLIKISDIFRTRLIRFYFKYVNGTLPSYFQDYFNPNSHYHSYGTRSSHEIRTDYRNTTHGRNTIRNFVPETISKLPIHVTDKISTHSYSYFSRYVNRFFIDSYESLCTRDNCYICQST